MSLLLGEIAEMVADGLASADLPYSMTIARLHQEPPPPGWPTYEIWDGPITVVEHVFQGWVDVFDNSLIAAGVVDEGDVKICLIQRDMPFRPELTDTITARGVTYTILSMNEDPAQAVLELRAKR